jgi:hypothetical protein
MEILQSTLEEITENEGKMPLLARARYGKFYSNAVECSFFLSNCIAGIDRSLADLRATEKKSGQALLCVAIN